MRPEHVAANQLVDIAHTEDREAYRAKLQQVEKEFGPIGYDNIKRNAARQYKSEVNDCRYVGWRADWINERRKAENNE